MTSWIYAALRALESWANRLQASAEDTRKRLDKLESERAGGRS